MRWSDPVLVEDPATGEVRVVTAERAMVGVYVAMTAKQAEAREVLRLLSGTGAVRWVRRGDTPHAPL